VDQYAWSTSPLRRYTDLVNQWQIIACVQHGVTAPLVAPFKPKDADLYAIVSAFDAAYGAYADFQSAMERYWCLRWLSQQQARQAEAVVLKEDLVRLVEIPLVLKLSGMPQLARGTGVRLDLLRWDEVDLSVDARLLGVEAGPGDASMADADDALADEEELAAGMPPLDADPAQQTEAAEAAEAARTAAGGSPDGGAGSDAAPAAA
jgi:exoribonuclease-2